MTLKNLTEIESRIDFSSFSVEKKMKFHIPEKDNINIIETNNNNIHTHISTQSKEGSNAKEKQRNHDDTIHR